MKSPWMKAVLFAVTFAVSACGGTQEAPDALESEQGQVEQQLPQCDENGECPVGFYCVSGPGGTCRKGYVRPAEGAVEQMLPQCDENGECPVGFYCVEGPGSTCRKGRVLAQ